MSSPTEAAPGGDSAVREMDVDAEMQDASTQEPAPTRQNEDADQDLVPQAETQQPATGAGPSGLSHQNRKDATLREFLSKMDDYAPIVGVLTT